MGDYENELIFAKDLAKKAGKIALRYFGFKVKSVWKEDNTPLTKADKEINELVLKNVKIKYPNYSVYSEEGSKVNSKSKYIWVCDPIDGTMAYGCGLPLFVFSIALIDQSTGLPMMGLVNDPIMKRMYWAIKGSGAYRDNQQIKVSSRTNFERTYTLTGASGKDVGFTSLPVHKVLGEKGSRVMKFPSFIYGAVQVANGMFDAGVFYGKYAHDIAALKIIAEEAGGLVTDLNGNERRYDQQGVGCIVSNKILHDEVLKIVQLGKI